jgi:hypothetical protein
MMNVGRERLRRTLAVRRDTRVRCNRFSDKITAEADPTNREQGQTMVEFAIVASLLLLLLFAIVDFSRLFFAYATMAHGVREGARYGVVNPQDENAIADLAESRMVVIGGQAQVDRDPFNMFPERDGEDQPLRCSRDCRIVVRATATLDVWTPILPSINIEAKATMHIE